MHITEAERRGRRLCFVTAPGTLTIQLLTLTSDVLHKLELPAIPDMKWYMRFLYQVEKHLINIWCRSNGSPLLAVADTEGRIRLLKLGADVSTLWVNMANLFDLLRRNV